MAKTIIGLYKTEQEAKAAREALINAKINPKEISVLVAANNDRYKELLSGGLGEAFTKAGIAQKDGVLYLEGIRRGYTLVSAHVDDQQAQAVSKIMAEKGAIDIERHANYWRSQGWDNTVKKEAGVYDRAHIEQERVGYESYVAQLDKGSSTAIPIIEEELRVGKREVESGGVRVETRVIETPVEENVSLRQESVQVQRRAVDRPVTAADANLAFKEGVLEVTAKSEQAVVDKQARVVEEVIVSKNVEQVNQTIRDSVRSTDVNVVQAAAQPVVTATEWQTYGSGLVANRAYAGRDWNSIEKEVRLDWEKRYGSGQSVWDDVKDAIRGSWEKAKAAVR